MARLTQHQVNTAKPEGAHDRMLADGNGLYLRVQGGGTKSWVFRYQRDGRAEKLRLGSTDELDLLDARAACARHRAAVRDGASPVAERKARRAIHANTLTVREFGPVYMQESVMGKSQYKRPEQVQRMLDAYLYPTMADVPLPSVDKRMATEPLFALVRRGKRVQANRLLSILKGFFAHAVIRDHIAVSPLQTITAKDVGGKETARTRYLSPTEVWRVFHELDEGHSKHAWQTRDALRLILLTGQRSGEVLGALTRANLSPNPLAPERWTIPLGYFKSSRHHTRDHVVHLSVQARAALLVAWHRDDDTREHVFVPARLPTNGQANGAATYMVRSLAQAVRSLLEGPHVAARDQRAHHRALDAGALHGMKLWTPHDLRRTFATGLCEVGAMPHIVEKCLNHKLEGIIGTYQHGECLPEREAAMALWGGVIDELLARPTPPPDELAWSDLRPRPTAVVIDYQPRAA